ncbi:hypothetical protein NX059_012003 [Plenodomus lindquistii]|nr:hypothetical protein NX059_012003 [Plenodomus lindquistii]
MDAPPSAPELKAAGSSTTECLLLKLPGELRNHIYDFAFEAPDTFQLFPFWREPGSSDSSPPRYSYLSLTQVCHQIRSEYRPLYYRRTQVVVSVKKLFEYIQTFVAPHGFEPRLAVHFINVRPESAVYDRPTRTRRTHSLYVLPLIDLQSTCPELNISFCPTDHIARFGPRVLNPLFNHRDYPKLRSYLRDHVSKVDVSSDPSGLYKLSLSIKRGSGKAWMHRVKTSRWSYHYPTKPSDSSAFDDWSDRLGLGALKREGRFIDFELDEPFLDDEASA